MGKKRQFDESEVLTIMAEHFWKHGYAATKVDQLSAITGLTKTSIYNAFGNKEALFLRVIDFYVERAFLPALQQIDAERSMTDNLEKLFELYFSEDQNQQLTYGCLLTNSILELAGNEPGLYDEATERFAQVREAMHQFFAVYENSGRLAPGVDTDELTDLFMTFLQGLRVQARNRHPAAPLERSIHLFLTMIRSVELSESTGHE